MTEPSPAAPQPTSTADPLPAGTPQPGDEVTCRVLGNIRTPYRRLEDCPNKHNRKAHLPCTIVLAPEYAGGLDGLKAGDRVLVLHWFHEARRDTAQLPVREGVRDKPVGVFSLRTPIRPNPIAATVAEILAVRDGELDVVGLDCLDGTPLLDLKRGRLYDDGKGGQGLS